jgi:hypothetical protein
MRAREKGGKRRASLRCLLFSNKNFCAPLVPRNRTEFQLAASEMKSLHFRRAGVDNYGSRIGCGDVLMYAQLSERFGAEDPGSCSSLWTSIHFQYELAL